MKEEQLRELLRRADGEDVPGEMSVVRIRRRAMQRRRGERVMLGLLVLVAAMGGSALFRPKPVVPPPSRASVAVTNPHAGEDEAVAAMRARIEVETTLLIARKRASGAMLAMDPGLAREAAAETLVITGDRRLARKETARAASAYEAAATLFPETEWGGRAQSALRRMQ